MSPITRNVKIKGHAVTLDVEYPEYEPTVDYTEKDLEDCECCFLFVEIEA